MGQVAETIERKLSEALSPTRLVVEDDSASHAGHAGNPGHGESHFNVTIVSPEFDGMNRVQRQRKVYGILADELAGPVHALALVTLSPTEDS